MKIAVIGAGLAGLSTSLHLLNLNPDLDLTIYDSRNNKASSYATMLHPYVGRRSNLSWQGETALRASKELLKRIQQNYPKPFSKETWLLKLANSEKQQQLFNEASQKHPKLYYQRQTTLNCPGLWSQVIQVNPHHYLDALEKTCVNLGANFKKQVFDASCSGLYDQIIFTTGASTSRLFPQFPFEKLKGQMLKVRWPKNHQLSYCMVSDGLHLSASFDNEHLIIGNTFERDVKDAAPCMQTAVELLWERAQRMLPQIEKNDILEVQAAMRLKAPSRLPVLGKIHNKTWIFTALASKGLLYHSYLGEMLAKSVLENSCEFIPDNVNISNFL